MEPGLELEQTEDRPVVVVTSCRATATANHLHLTLMTREAVSSAWYRAKEAKRRRWLPPP